MFLSFKEFIEEEIANTTANVDGMRTEPLISRRTQAMYVRRNARLKLKKEEPNND
jgi:hypothetical protein